METDTTVEHVPRRRPRRRWLRYAALLVLGVVVLVGLAATLTYRRQIVAYVTHLKGGPEETWAWEPHEPPPVLHIAVAGDVGEPGDRIEATGASVAAVHDVEPFDALLLLGDNSYPDGNPDQLPGAVFGPFHEVLDDGTELLAILGNHDVHGSWADEQLDDLGMEGRYWSRTWGDVLLVGLDSTELDDPVQLAFLEETLASTDARWRIVALHHPPFSSGYQGSSEQAREVVVPILEEHGVQLVLSGHDHDYQRSAPIDGVTYVVSGAGALTRRTGEDGFTAAAYSWHHFVELAIGEDQLVLRAIGNDGSVFDEATIAVG